VLVAGGGLPHFEGEVWRLPDVRAELEPSIGTPTYLRLAAQIEPKPEHYVRLHVFDTSEGESLGFDEVDVPPEFRAEYERWVAEQRGAPVPELRSAWARPGWLDDVRAWAGLPLEPLRMWSLSAVLRSGDTYLKAVFPLFHHEPAVTEALARAHPGRVPDVLRIEPERGWMLMRELPGEARRDPVVLRTLGKIQRAWCDRVDELLALGAPDRRLDVLEVSIAGLVADEAPELAHAVPALEAACRAAHGLPATLVHGDFHSGNALVDDAGRAVLFDWSDACVAHPLFDLHLYAFGDEDEQALVAAYSEGWGEDVSDALALTAAPSCLHQAVSYRAIQSASEAKFWFKGAARDWLERAVALVT
jgi:hypothetical protein